MSTKTVDSSVGGRGHQDMRVSSQYPVPQGKVKDNGDISITPAVERFFCFLDGVGGVRQAAFAVAASATLVSSVAAPVIAAIATAAASVGLLFSGVFTMATVVTITIPYTRSSLKKAQEELRKVQSTAKDTDPKVKSAKQMVTIRKLGLASQSILFVMTAVQCASGVVYMLGSAAASLMHYSAVLTGASAALAGIVTNVALGAIYTFRGTVMIYKACLALSMVSSFKKDFKNCKDLHDKMAFLQSEEVGGEAYMQPRVDASCLEKTLADGRVCTMTAAGYKFEDGSVEQYSNDTERQEYVQRVEKGIFSEQLKQMVYAAVGVSMIIGGVLTLAVTALTHGLAPIAISLASAVFFMLAEFIFLSHDSPQFLDCVRDRLFGPIKEGQVPSSGVSVDIGSAPVAAEQRPPIEPIGEGEQVPLLAGLRMGEVIQAVA